MSGWLDGADVAPLPVIPPGAAGMALRPPGKPSTLGEAFDAAGKAYDAIDLSTTRNFYAGRIGGDIIRDLKTRGRTGYQTPQGTTLGFTADVLRTDNGLNPYVAPHVFAAIRAEQARDPKFHAEITGPEAFEAAIVKARGIDHAEASQVLAGSAGISGFLAQTAGGLYAAAQDPLQIGTAIVSAPIGGAITSQVAQRLGLTAASSWAKRVALGAAVDGGVNMLATAPMLPVKAMHSAELGIDYGAGDAAGDLLTAGLFGGALHVTGASLWAGTKGLFALPGKIVDTPSSARLVLKKMGAIQRRLTPEEVDAAHVLTAEAMTVESSPFKPTPAGDAEHAARLRAAMDAHDRGEPVPDMPPVPPEMVAAPEARFEPTPQQMKAAIDYARDRQAEPLTGEAFGAAAGLTAEEGRAVLSRLASTPAARGVVVMGGKGLKRPMQRRGPVDLLTQIADAGGVRDTEGHDIARGIGNPFTGGAGPLVRKNGPGLDDIGLWLHERGWFPGQDRPTTADVLDLIGQAVRGKVWHPDDVPAVMDKADAAANAEWQQRMSGEISAASKELGVKVPKGETHDAVLRDIAAGADAHEAVAAHINRAFDEAMTETRMGLDHADHEDAFFGDGADPRTQAGDRQGDGGGRAAVPGDARQGAVRGGELGEHGADGGAEGGSAGSASFDAHAGADALKAFDDPRGDGPRAQADSIEHDLRAELDSGPAVDPSVAARTKQETQLRADGPMRGKAVQSDLTDTGLFGQVDLFALPDGTAGKIADVLQSIDDDAAALAAMKGCI